ncbi:MAG: hypothetical protein FK732_09355 [Asgard group archaeon]|nr:hypothetical protein [Asgard group archaeon]
MPANSQKKFSLNTFLRGLHARRHSGEIPSDEEIITAYTMLENPEFTKKDCMSCHMELECRDPHVTEEADKTIYDTDFCKRHANELFFNGLAPYAMKEFIDNRLKTVKKDH